MNDMKRNIRRVFWLYFALFALLVMYLCKFVLADSREIVANSYNPRMGVTDPAIKRGDVRDRNGNLLASSNQDASSAYRREYPYGKAFAHVVGYTDHGKTGVEAKYNFEMETLSHEIYQRARGLLMSEEICADSAVLTLDADLQRFAYETMGGRKGSVVVMEPSTGKILCMVSHPAFDPESIASDWAALKDDEENSPLLNRASQGMYPPGSVFKIVTAAAVIEHWAEYQDFVYECRGEETFGNNRIRCYDGKVHGEVGLEDAFAQSCNTYFATVGMELGPDVLRGVAERAGFNAAYPFALVNNRSSFVLSEASTEGEVIATSFGQGKTLVTPLHMAMITSAVGNGGVMMKPYIVDHFENYDGTEKGKVLPALLGQAFSQEETTMLTDMMRLVVEVGTGKNVRIDGVQVAGKTGSAENGTGADHGWFVGFAPADNPKVAVSVILENCGGSINALPLAREVMAYALKLE